MNNTMYSVMSNTMSSAMSSMISNPLNLAWAFAAGMLLGSLFFGGLWWTTRKAVMADNPALWFFGSLLLRNGGVLTGFYFVTSGDWHRALACMFGFIVARLMVLRFSDTLYHPVAATEVHRES